MEKFDIDDPCPKIHTMAKYQDLRSAVRVELNDMCTKDECLFLLVDYTSRKALQKNVKDYLQLKRYIRADYYIFYRFHKSAEDMLNDVIQIRALFRKKLSAISKGKELFIKSGIIDIPEGLDITQFDETVAKQMIAKLYKLSGNNQYLADKIETAKSFTTSYVLAHGKDAVAEQHLRVKEYNESQARYRKIEDSFYKRYDSKLKENEKLMITLPNVIDSQLDIGKLTSQQLSQYAPTQVPLSQYANQNELEHVWATCAPIEMNSLMQLSHLASEQVIFANQHRQKYCTPPGFYWHQGKQYPAYCVGHVRWAKLFDFLSPSQIAGYRWLSQKYSNFSDEHLRKDKVMSSKDRSPSSNKTKVDTTFNYKNPLSQLAIYLSCMQGNFVLNCKYLALAALSLFKQKSADVVINQLSERGLQLEDVYVVDNSLRFYRHQPLFTADYSTWTQTNYQRVDDGSYIAYQKDIKANQGKFPHVIEFISREVKKKKRFGPWGVQLTRTVDGKEQTFVACVKVLMESKNVYRKPMILTVLNQAETIRFELTKAVRAQLKVLPFCADAILHYAHRTDGVEATDVGQKHFFFGGPPERQIKSESDDEESESSSEGDSDEEISPSRQSESFVLKPYRSFSQDTYKKPEKLKPKKKREKKAHKKEKKKAMTQDEKLKYLESQRIKKIYQLGNFKDTDEFSEDKQSSSGQVKYKKPLPPQLIEYMNEEKKRPKEERKKERDEKKLLRLQELKSTQKYGKVSKTGYWKVQVFELKSFRNQTVDTNPHFYAYIQMLNKFGQEPQINQLTSKKIFYELMLGHEVYNIEDRVTAESIRRLLLKHKQPFNVLFNLHVHVLNHFVPASKDPIFTNSQQTRILTYTFDLLKSCNLLSEQGGISIEAGGFKSLLDMLELIQTERTLARSSLNLSETMKKSSFDLTQQGSFRKSQIMIISKIVSLTLLQQIIVGICNFIVRNDLSAQLFMSAVKASIEIKEKSDKNTCCEITQEDITVFMTQTDLQKSLKRQGNLEELELLEKMRQTPQSTETVESELLKTVFMTDCSFKTKEGVLRKMNFGIFQIANLRVLIQLIQETLPKFTWTGTFDNEQNIRKFKTFVETFECFEPNDTYIASKQKERCIQFRSDGKSILDLTSTNYRSQRVRWYDRLDQLLQWIQKGNRFIPISYIDSLDPEKNESFTPTQMYAMFPSSMRNQIKKSQDAQREVADSSETTGDATPTKEVVTQPRAKKQEILQAQTFSSEQLKAQSFFTQESYDFRGFYPKVQGYFSEQQTPCGKVSASKSDVFGTSRDNVNHNTFSSDKNSEFGDFSPLHKNRIPANKNLQKLHQGTSIGTSQVPNSSDDFETFYKNQIGYHPVSKQQVLPDPILQTNFAPGPQVLQQPIGNQSQSNFPQGNPFLPNKKIDQVPDPTLGYEKPKVSQNVENYAEVENAAGQEKDKNVEKKSPNKQVEEVKPQSEESKHEEDKVDESKKKKKQSEKKVKNKEAPQQDMEMINTEQHRESSASANGSKQGDKPQKAQPQRNSKQSGSTAGTSTTNVNSKNKKSQQTIINLKYHPPGINFKTPSATPQLTEQTGPSKDRDSQQEPHSPKKPGNPTENQVGASKANSKRNSQKRRVSFGQDHESAHGEGEDSATPLKLAEDELFEDFPDGLDDEEQEAKDQIYGKEGPKKDEDAEASD